MSTTRETLGTIKFGSSTILHCTDINIDPQPSVAPIAVDGIFSPTSQIVYAAKPQITFTCVDLLTVLTSLSLQANSITSNNVVVYIRNITNEGIAGTTSGTSYTLGAGILVINTISMRQGTYGVATGSIYFDSSDGVTSWTVAEGSASLPSLTALTDLLWLAPVSLNGTAYTDTTGWELSTGNQVVQELSDGNLIPQVCWLAQHAPTVTITSINPGTIRTALGDKGLILNGSTGLSLPTYQTTNGVVSSTTPTYGTMTIKEGMATSGPRASSQGGLTRFTWKVEAAYDLTNAPIIVS